MKCELLFLNISSYFTNDPEQHVQMNRGIFDSDFFPPLNMMYLVSYIKKYHPNYKVGVIDTVVEYTELEELENILGPYRSKNQISQNDLNEAQIKTTQYFKDRREKALQEFEKDLALYSPSVVAIPFHYTADYSRACKMLSTVRKILPHTKIIIGGNFATSYGAKLLELHKEIDILILEEAEIALGEILESRRDPKDLKKIKGIIFRSADDDIVTTDSRDLVKDIDIFPNPYLTAGDFKVDKRRKIVSLMPWLEQRVENIIPTQSFDPIGQIITSRGCPFNCLYCANKKLSHQKLRFHSISYVEEMVQYCVSEFNLKYAYLGDAIYTVNKNRVKELSRALKKFNMKWYCQTRLDFLDEEVLSACSEMGMYSIALGIETLNPKTLVEAKKTFVLKDLQKATHYMKKFSIHSLGTFIVGLPGDKTFNIIKNAKQAKKSGLDKAVFFPMIATIGTDLFERYLKEVPENKRVSVGTEKFDYIYTAKYSKPTMFFLVYLSHFIYAGRVLSSIGHLIKKFFEFRSTSSYFR